MSTPRGSGRSKRGGQGQNSDSKYAVDLFDSEAIEAPKESAATPKARQSVDPRASKVEEFFAGAEDIQLPEADLSFTAEETEEMEPIAENTAGEDFEAIIHEEQQEPKAAPRTPVVVRFDSSRKRNEPRKTTPSPMIVLPQVSGALVPTMGNEEEESLFSENISFAQLPRAAARRAANLRWREIEERTWWKKVTAGIAIAIVAGTFLMTLKALKQDHWVLSAQNAETAIEANRLQEAQGYINEVLEQSDTSAVAFELEARRAAKEGDRTMASAAAKAGVRYSSHWRSDLMLSRVLAGSGDIMGAALSAEAAFVRGAPIQYASEIAARQRAAGRDLVAGRVLEYKAKVEKAEWPTGH